MARIFLVTGATGATGRDTVHHLLQAGASVRAFIHREDERSEFLRAQGAQLRTGNLLDFESVRSAMDGVEGAYFVYTIMPGLLQATAYFAQAAAEARLKIVVNMSQISARREARSHAAQDHWIAEQVLNWSGIPMTHLRPTLFAEWALYWVAQFKTGTLTLPFGTGRHAPIAAEDQARVIAKVLLSPEDHVGKVYPLYGRQEYTFAEITEEISKVVGKPLRYQQIEASDLQQRSTGIAKNPGHQNDVFAGTDDTVERITGQPPVSLPDFLQAHRSELSAH